MAFTVIGMFDSKPSADNAASVLKSRGFQETDIDHSPYRSTDTETIKDNRYYDYEEDEKTTGFFDWLFGDDDDNRTRYSEAASRSYVITVHAKNKVLAEKAADIMNNAGAIDVDEHARGYARRTVAGSTAAMTSVDATHAGLAKNDATRNVHGTEKLEVVEEDINVGKRTVQTGGVKIRSRIVEKPVEEKLRLREERVYVRRNPVNRPAKLSDLDTFETKTINLKEEAEVAVVEKNARVVEEVEIGKDVNTEVETIHDTVRKTKVEVEEVAGVDLETERKR